MAEDWRSEAFRRKVIAQIDEAVRMVATPMTKSSNEMENHVFLKAKTREEYLALVARLILHVKGINAQKDQEKKVVGPGGMMYAQQQGMPLGGATGLQQQPMHDPINTLQNQGTTIPGQQTERSMSATGWGQLAPFEAYGRIGDSKEDFLVITYDVATSETYAAHKHASHTMILARDARVLWDLYPARAAVLMQMRFDGVIGFPGGLVDPGEDPVEAANREMVEEVGIDLTKHSITKDNHIVSYFNAKKSLVLHFFGLEVTLEEFRTIELRNLQAPDYGSETLGLLRPPLYTMGDNYRGLPAFLSNGFAGNAQDELLVGLQHFKTHTAEEIQVAVGAQQQHADVNRGRVGHTNINS